MTDNIKLYLLLQDRRALIVLSKDETIINPAQSSCTADYHNKISPLLDEHPIYEKLKRDSTSNYKKKGERRLETFGTRGLYQQGNLLDTACIMEKLFLASTDFLRRTTSQTIVSSINSLTYNIAKYLATILAPLVGHNDHHIQNFEEFTSKIRVLKLDTDETMVCFDVTFLFTSISTTDALTALTVDATSTKTRSTVWT